MKAIGVDQPFQETKTKKTSLKREMFVEVCDDGVAYLNIILSVDLKSQPEKQELTTLRTAASSMLQNLKLVCETIKEFGN